MYYRSSIIITAYVLTRVDHGDTLQVEEPMLTKSRKEHQHAVRMDDRFSKAAELMCKEHGAGSFSDYIRGLIVLDSLLNTGVFVGNVPYWFRRRYPFTFIGDAHENLRAARD